MALQPQWVGRSSVFAGCATELKRELYFLSVPNIEHLLESDIALPGKNSAIFLAWDSRDVDVPTIFRFITSLLDKGAVYFCCFGPDCERIHDCVDEECVTRNIDSGEEHLIMTTWHSQDTLLEALYFFAADSKPSEEYAGTCGFGVAISIGNAEWDTNILDGLSRAEELFMRSNNL